MIVDKSKALRKGARVACTVGAPGSGAPLGNQNALKHGVYCCSWDTYFSAAPSSENDHQVVAIWFQDCLFAKILRADYSGSAIIAIAVVNVFPSFAKRWVITEIELLR